jgi:apurinic endonuclease APN1
MVFIGIHLNKSRFEDITNALDQAIKMKANVLQIFLGDNRLTTLRHKIILNPTQITEIKKILKDNNIKLYVHSIFSLNFCNDPSSIRFKWGLDNLIYDMNICKKLGALGCVLHMGSFKTKKLNITPEKCIENYINSLITVLKSSSSKVPILLETPVNRKTIIGGTTEKLANIYSKIPVEYKKRIKFCVDTAHIFVSGYNISQKNILVDYFNDFDKLIGIKNILLIHLNDSERNLGSIINRHETIGKGYIFKSKYGKESLEYLINFSKENNISLVLETKYIKYMNELKYIKSLVKKGGKFEIIKQINYKPQILKIFKELLSFHQSIASNNIQKRFRIQSYEKIIKILENLKTPIYSIDDIKNIDGIGKSSLLKIDEIIKTGTLSLYKNIKKNNIIQKNIKSISQFQKIWGFGIKLSKEIVLKYGIYTISELKKAVKLNRIILSRIQKIGLEYYEDLKKRIPRKEIEYYTKMFNKIKINKDKIYETHNAGSYRLGKKTSGDIDIIISVKSGKNINTIKKLFYNKLRKKHIIKETLVDGENKSIYIIHSKKYNIYRQLDIIFIDKKNLPWYLLYFGSSKDFSKKIRSISAKKGYKLNEYGLFNRITGKKINFEPKTEKDIFDYLKIDYIPPEKR